MRKVLLREDRVLRGFDWYDSNGVLGNVLMLSVSRKCIFFLLLEHDQSAGARYVRSKR